jgi:hypothetical protein
VAPDELAAQIRQLCQIALTSGIQEVRGSLIAASEQALEIDDPKCRELAEQLLRELRQIPT